MKKDNELDDIFRNGLGDPPDADFREGDWDALEDMLDGSKRRKGLIFWLPVISAAAVLLLIFGLWLLRPVAPQHGKKTLAVNPVKKTTEDSLVAKSPGNKSHNLIDTIQPHTQQQAIAQTTVKNDSAAGRNSNRIAATGVPHGAKSDEPLMPGVNDGTTATGDAAAKQQTELFAANANAQFTDSVSGFGGRGLPVLPANALAANTKQKPANRITKQGFVLSHPQYALSVLGAPEVNGVNSLNQTRSGTNLGLMFSAQWFRKITISTGALYSFKPYDAHFDSYSSAQNGSRSNLTSINANCRVLDIPLNIDYQIYHHQQNKFSVGTGLSSYIMLHENYQYNYTNPATNPTVNYTVPYTNKYFLGVLNLQATYTRQVTSNVGISLQPYMKLPLTGIGANNARLQTAGVAVGVSWNLPSLTKP